jgi:branched-chain amino acid transport system substrate-binding protein
MRHIKFLRFALLITLLVIAISPVQAQEESKVVFAPGTAIKMAVATDLTNHIPEFGQDIANGAQLAVNEINAAGGIKGFQVELVIEDDRCEGADGTTVASRVASVPEIVAVVGHICSAPTIAAAEVYEQARIPMMSPSATNALLTSQGYDVFNRVAGSDEVQGKVDAHYMYEVLGFRKIAILHDNALYGQGLSEVVDRVFKELGGEVTSLQGIDTAAQDFRPVLTTLVAEAPEAIFFGGYVQQAVLLVPQKNDVGLQDVVFFSDDGIYGPDFIEGAGDAAEGVYASFPYGVELTGEEAAAQQERQDAFLAAYKETFGVDPMGPYHFHAYDAAMLLMQAMDAVAVVDDAGNLVIDREELIKAVREIKDYAGLTGNLTCGPTGECGSFIIGINQVVDGEWVRLELPQDLIDMQMP